MNMKRAKPPAPIRFPLFIVGIFLLTVVVNLSRDVQSTSMQTKNSHDIVFNARTNNVTKGELYGGKPWDEAAYGSNPIGASSAGGTLGDFVGSSRTVLAYPQRTWQNQSSPVQDLGLRIYVYETSAWPQQLAEVKECRL